MNIPVDLTFQFNCCSGSPSKRYAVIPLFLSSFLDRPRRPLCSLAVSETLQHLSSLMWSTVTVTEQSRSSYVLHWRPWGGKQPDTITTFIFMLIRGPLNAGWLTFFAEEKGWVTICGHRDWQKAWCPTEASEESYAGNNSTALQVLCT